MKARWSILWSVLLAGWLSGWMSQPVPAAIYAYRVDQLSRPIRWITTARRRLSDLDRPSKTKWIAWSGASTVETYQEPR